MILSLDLAGKTGYCIKYDTGEIKTGLWILTRGDLGGRRSPIPSIRIWNRLARLSETHKIEKIIFEETFGRGDAKYRLDSLQHAVVLWASLVGVPFVRLSPSAWKKKCLGNGSIKKEIYWEKACDKWPHLPIHSDDIAAALWMMDMVEGV